MAFLLGGLFFLIAIDSTYNGGFYFSASHLWLPLAALIFGYTWWHRKYFVSVTKRKKSPWITAAIVYPLVLLMSWPWLMALNAVTGTGAMVTYSGPIQGKWINHGKSRSYHFSILDDSSHEIIKLNCNASEYSRLSIGSIASRTFQLGGFGIPYRWRFHWSSTH
ncbi:MAG: hypothetical protein ACREKL_12420 [Chthoniobacterales bacterium]